MIKKDALQDLSILTTIPYNNVQKLFDMVGDIIAYDLQESIKNKESKVSIDIGIGVLNLTLDNDEIHYKFIPSNKFEQELIDVVTNGNLNLIDNIEQTISKRVMSTYKDLF